MTGADFKSLLEQAADGPLTREEAETVFEIIMTGGATPVRIAGFLMALRARGEDTAEIAAAAAVMRRHAVAVEAPEGAIDVVGTGGDGKGTLNISTAAAFITAGAGVPVAKHGNRALSSRSGAADALGLLGVDVSVGPEVVARAINEAGIGFMMAPMHHPAMRHVQPVRIELAARTIFNILGPLTNPAGVKRQLTGAFSVAALNPMAETLRALGSEKAWLVHGGDGTDEISIAGPTTVVQLADGVIAEFEVSPELAGLPVHPFEDIIGGAPEENVARLRALLDGEAGAYRDASLLNAGAALLIADRVADLAEGVEMAAESVDSGAAKRAVEALARITTEAAAAVKAG